MGWGSRAYRPCGMPFSRGTGVWAAAVTPVPLPMPMPVPPPVPGNTPGEMLQVCPSFKALTLVSDVSSENAEGAPALCSQA